MTPEQPRARASITIMLGRSQVWWPSITSLIGEWVELLLGLGLGS